MNRIAVLGATVLLSGAVALAGQTTPHIHQEDRTPTQGRAQLQSAPEHMTEAAFVSMMLQHHADGIEMARIAEQKATSREVKALARTIREGQEREAREMKPFAADATGPVGTSGRMPQGHREHQPGHQAQGGDQAHQEKHQAHMQQSKQAIERVRAATGKAVDLAFLEEMAKHHEMAIEMTRETRFDTARLKQMAEKMSENQRRELEQLLRTRQRVS